MSHHDELQKCDSNFECQLQKVGVFARLVCFVFCFEGPKGATDFLEVVTQCTLQPSCHTFILDVFGV